MGKCRFCGTDCQLEEDFDSDRFRIDCPKCGEYWLTEEATDVEPDSFIQEYLYLLSAVVRRSWDRGERLVITKRLLGDRSEFESRILSLCPKGIQDKMNIILRHIAENSECPSAQVKIVSDRECARLYCRNGPEVDFFLKSLEDQRLLHRERVRDFWKVALTADGWLRIEELAQPNTESRQAFVAMWFDGTLDTAYAQGIAGIEQDTGFKALRIDMEPFNEKICDRIIAEIRRSRFLIADVTEHRQGVYFEAGYAMGFGLPVIWTCRKDQINKCHFDTRQYNHITWEEPEELREKLSDRILATISNAQ